MSDDEAFIRAIVATPGDEAPRLVYADWLDERGDARGAYLRAEAEWVAADRPGGRGAMTRKARGLDPVWVARVSRPPAGVCSDHLGLSSRGPGAEPADLDAVGAGLGVALPPQFRALLLNNDLGHLKGGPFLRHDPDLGRRLPVDGFVCLTDPERTEGYISYELVDRTEWLREEYGLNSKLMFLAGTFEETEFVVSCRRSDNGSVHQTDGERMQDEPGTGVKRIARSVGEFLAMLEPRTWPLTDY